MTMQPPPNAVPYAKMRVRAMVSVPRRAGELAVIAGLAALVLANFGWHQWLGWSSTMIGGVLMVGGAALILLSRVIRGRLMSHHARHHSVQHDPGQKV